MAFLKIATDIESQTQRDRRLYSLLDFEHKERAAPCRAFGKHRSIELRRFYSDNGCYFEDLAILLRNRFETDLYGIEPWIRGIRA